MKPLSITPDTTDICIPTEGFEGQTGLTVRLERVGRRGNTKSS
jgi:hypothetical protein